MSQPPRRFAIASVFSAVVAVVAVPIGGSIWGYAYGHFINGSMDPLGEVMFGGVIGFCIAFLLLVLNAIDWYGREHERMLRTNVAAVALSALPIVVIMIVGIFQR